jgi:hypothetical protein
MAVLVVVAQLVPIGNLSLQKLEYSGVFPEFSLDKKFHHFDHQQLKDGLLGAMEVDDFENIVQDLLIRKVEDKENLIVGKFRVFCV